MLGWQFFSPPVHYKRDPSAPLQNTQTTILSSPLYFLGIQVDILQSFSLECTSAKLAVLNLRELLRHNDLHLKSGELSFQVSGSYHDTGHLLLLPAAITVLFLTI